MLKYISTLFLIIFFSIAHADIKEKIIENLKNTQNLNFNFEQNINGKIENGNCIIEYPKKIICKYEVKNKKILVSNGKSLVIKTTSSFYRYPLEKTPLNFILDKNFLINKIIYLEERMIHEAYIDYAINEKDSKINVFFDKKTFNLIGWQTVDIYQNISITHLNSISKNKEIKKYIFRLPKKN